MEDKDTLEQARMRLIEVGGKISKDLGTGRIVGQVLIYLYLQENECSLDCIAEDLSLSKASVSISVRQLEQFGLAREVWKGGDKKNYYRSAENIAKALQQGVLSLVRQKVKFFGTELETSLGLLNTLSESSLARKETKFLQQRIERAQDLQNRLEWVLGNPFVKLLSGVAQKKK